MIMEELARTEEVAFSHVMLVHKDKILQPADTPTSIDLHTADIISEYIYYIPSIDTFKHLNC